MADHDTPRAATGGRGRPGNAAASPITSLTGSTAGGMPLALNRAPGVSLRPWVARIGVTDVVLPAGDVIACRTFHEHPVVRVIFGSRWSTQTADGHFDFDPGEEGLALYFGPNSRQMPLVAHGSFRVVTINCGPGAGETFALPQPRAMLDRIIQLENDSIGSYGVLPGYRPQADKRAWLDAVEQQIGAALGAGKPPRPSAMMTAFETLCLTDPGASLDNFADVHGVTRRTLERAILRGWGVTPHQAQRRARALDMAAVLLGVALEEEEQELRLRYFDQSHLIREMRQYFDMTPGQLKNAPCPLLRITMEIRQARRVEALAHIGVGQPPPWRDPHAEPAG